MKRREEHEGRFEEEIGQLEGRYEEERGREGDIRNEERNMR